MDPNSDHKPTNPNPPAKSAAKKKKDFLTHLEIYLAKRDGVDKLLKISRYAAKLIVASSLLHSHPLASRLQSFESSVGISRKAFRLGKFVQDVNALRAIDFASHSNSKLLLSAVAYGGEGFYYFIEQLLWLGKAGLIDKRHLPALQKLSAWCEFVGYFGSVSLKVMEIGEIAAEEERCVAGKEEEKVRKLREKKVMKRLSVVQDLADGLMALADIRDGGGVAASPLLLAAAGLLSALISTHKNWISC